ncbi:multiple sugar-binding transport ATP-binding protein [Spiroplasma sabaudiense Ar-1343]|uniref:Multiple sugar-binding transport ATP-binding protein n=1 Tax=Spiroplasma sabaudiense Ar-1343 TaxID=1276257 RepID=W6ABP4_9MOLU|nr:ABC transporter ATP-binding protein [Spiroplasma sabaudiense]AHI54250.1 multiple sugar-binding transport ATP-binding protein [Spiroplasma sabaudiense Ar-1343]
MKVELRNLSKKYEGNPLYTLENINLSIEDKDFCVMLGPSGCGKTTLLRMIAGLNSITKGDLVFDEKRANDLPPKDRDIAMVFQSYALYPHMNVYKNMGFGLKMKKAKKDLIDQRVKDVAEILNITHLLYKKPSEISGGQRQRVALGRAIVRKPKLFLMDEPLSNLDAKLRETMRTEIVKIHKALESTTIYVTHDQVEAMTMATKIVLMNDQKIQQVGSPTDLYENPENLFVANFIGNPTINQYKGILEGEYFVNESKTIKVKLSKEEIETIKKQNSKWIYLCVRSESVKISKSKTDTQVLVIHVELLGKEKEIKGFVDDNSNISVTVSNNSEVEADQKINVVFEKYFLFDGESQKRIR